MTIHPDDAMTRERALEEINILEGRLLGVHSACKSIAKQRDALDERAERFRAALQFYRNPAGKCEQVPDFYDELDFGKTARAALASAKQEPAPSADAEEVMKFATKVACDWGHSQCAPVVADAIRKDRALRRYAGDGEVTDAEVNAFCKAMGCTGNHTYIRSVRNALEAAARAKSSEKGRAR